MTPIQIDFHLNDSEDTMISRYSDKDCIPRKNDYVHLYNEAVLYQVESVVWHYYEAMPVHITIELGRPKSLKKDK